MESFLVVKKASSGVILGALILGVSSSVSAQLRSGFQGPLRAKVVVVEHSEATDSFRPLPSVAQKMLTQGITRLTGTASIEQAWAKFVSPEDVVGVKVLSEPGASGGTRPAVAAAVIEQMIDAGISPNRIILWDRNLITLRLAGFGEVANRYGVQLAGAIQAGYDPQKFYASSILGKPVWGDHEFSLEGPEVGRNSYVSKLLTQRITKIVNVSPLLNHNTGGVYGNLVGLALGSVDNTIRFETDAARLAVAVPEINALEAVGDMVVLNIVDALMCQYQGETRGLLHYSKVLNQLRMSTDPVALDLLSIQEIQRQRAERDLPKGRPNIGLYNNAALLLLGISDPKQIGVDFLRLQ